MDNISGQLIQVAISKNTKIGDEYKVTAIGTVKGKGILVLKDIEIEAISGRDRKDMENDGLDIDMKKYKEIKKLKEMALSKRNK